MCRLGLLHALFNERAEAVLVVRLDFEHVWLFVFWDIFDNAIHLGDEVACRVAKLKLATVLSFVPDRETCAAQIFNDPRFLQVSRLKQAKHAPFKLFTGETSPVEPDLTNAFFAYKRRAKPPEVQISVCPLFLNSSVDPIDDLLLRLGRNGYHLLNPTGCRT